MKYLTQKTSYPQSCRRSERGPGIFSHQVYSIPGYFVGQRPDTPEIQVYLIPGYF